MDSTKSLELKILDCKDLKAFNFFQKLLVYVAVSLVSDDPEKKVEKNQRQRTPTDSEGDGNPEWKHEMQFDLSEISFADCDHLFLRFDLCHEGLYFGDKVIGEVRVPLKDIMQESSGIQRFVNYQVQSPDGSPNGILSFSYKVNVKAKDSGIEFPASGITGYSVVHHHHHQFSPENQNQSPEFQSSSPVIQYPSLELEQQIHPPAVSYPYNETLYPPQESHYPPGPYGHYPPPPPPLPHIPPAAGPYGGCYRPHYLPEFRPPWPPGPVYDHHGGGNWSPSHGFGHEERWRNDFGDRWNGR